MAESGAHIVMMLFESWKKELLSSAVLFALVGLAATCCCTAQAQSNAASFGPGNPFYAPSTLPFHAPPFNKIKDSDYQPAIDAGMAQQIKEVEAIANNPAPPTFENTVAALERTGQLLNRAYEAFNCVTGANTDDELRKRRRTKRRGWPRRPDAIHLNAKLFARIKAVYDAARNAASRSGVAAAGGV